MKGSRSPTATTPTRTISPGSSELFEKDVTVFPVVSGTASNALATITPSYGKVFCHAMSHINTDEWAAPEFFTGGAKLVPIDSDDGKIRPTALAEVVRGAGNVHAAQPATLSITQSCETGRRLSRTGRTKGLSGLSAIVSHGESDALGRGSVRSEDARCLHEAL